MTRDELNTNEELALDAMLAEIHGQSAPPDLAPQILAGLLSDVAPVPVVVDVYRARRRSRKPFVSLITAVAVLAASVLLVVWIRHQPDQPNDETRALAVNNQSAPDVVPIDSVAQDSLTEPDVPLIDPSNQPRPIPRGIPLVTNENDQPRSDSADDLRPPWASPTAANAADMSLVSTQVDEDLSSYWQAVGIQPTQESSPAEIAGRLSQLLGVQVSEAVLSDPAVLREELAATDVAPIIANKWLAQVTGNGASRMDRQLRQQLIDQIAASFVGKQRLDETVGSWIGGESEHSSAWYSAIAAAGKESLVHRLASLSMNVDLRCTQCHDALIQGSGRQDDYWAFAAFVAESVRRDRDGQWTVGKSDQPAKPMFYELPDGRQRLVQPSLPVAWLSASDLKPIEDVRQWSRQIVGTPEFAGGVVNSLWQLVHGRPLRGSVVDTMSAPHHEMLDQLEQRLISDLQQSNFDVTRTLALIVSSPATRRSIPTLLEPANALVASDAELGAARDLVGAFAAALPLQSKPPLMQRVDVAMRSVGGSIKSIGDSNTINAQADDSPGSDKRPIKQTKDLAAGFPTSVGDLPVQWLLSIKGYQNRVEHLGYLAGMNRVPTEVIDASVAMKDAEQISEELALHRVWWLLSP